MSKVPCITSVVLSGIKVLSSYWHPSGAYACPTGCQEEKTLNFIRKRPQNSSWRGTVREVGTQSGREEKREARAGSVASRVEVMIISTACGVTISVWVACSLVGFRSLVCPWSSTTRPLLRRRSSRTRSCTAPQSGRDWSLSQVTASDCSRGNTGRKRGRRQRGNG